MMTPPYGTSTVLTFLNGKRYALQKLEFTSPSENSLDGESFSAWKCSNGWRSQLDSLIELAFLKENTTLFIKNRCQMGSK